MTDREAWNKRHANDESVRTVDRRRITELTAECDALAARLATVEALVFDKSAGYGTEAWLEQLRAVVRADPSEATTRDPGLRLADDPDGNPDEIAAVRADPSEATT